NYVDWARNIATSLTRIFLCKFINGTTVKPTEPVDLYSWLKHNQLVMQLILASIVPTEHQHIDQYCNGFETSEELWGGMRRLYLHAGVTAQVNFLRHAFSHIFPPTGLFGPTIQELHDDVQHLYSVVTPSADDMFSILLLQALAAHHPSKCDNFQSSGTFDSLTICQRLEGFDLQYREELRLAARASSSSASLDVAAAVTTGKPSACDRMPCKHCNKSNHPLDKCWQKFGKPEWQQLKECDRKA
ncbi:hypothetical protein EWM64_g7156, partial [Hericium alpestre]